MSLWIRGSVATTDVLLLLSLCSAAESKHRLSPTASSLQPPSVGRLYHLQTARHEAVIHSGVAVLGPDLPL